MLQSHSAAEKGDFPSEVLQNQGLPRLQKARELNHDPITSYQLEEDNLDDNHCLQSDS